MCIRDSDDVAFHDAAENVDQDALHLRIGGDDLEGRRDLLPVSYTHLRAHETVLDLVCRLLLEKKKITKLLRHIYAPDSLRT